MEPGFPKKLFDPADPADIFADHIEFEVDLTTGSDGLHIGMFEGIGNDGHVEPGFFYIEDGKADAVEADGAFFDDEVGEFFGKFQPELPASVHFLSFQAGGCRVYVSLDDVAIQPAVQEHTSLQVDEVACLPGFHIGLLEGFFDGCHPVEAIFYLFYGETDPVVGDALIDFKFLREGGFYPEGFVGALGGDGPDPAE